PAAPAPTPAPAATPGRGTRRGRGRADRAPAVTTPRAGRAGVRTWIARAVATLVAIAVFLWGFAELRASRAAAAAQAWMTSAPANAFSAARYAAALGPHEDRLWRMLAETALWRTALGDSSREGIADAVVAARRAVELEPERAENHVILARALGIAAGHGDGRAMEAMRLEFARALALAPMDALTLMAL